MVGHLMNTSRIRNLCHKLQRCVAQIRIHQVENPLPTFHLKDRFVIVTKSHELFTLLMPLLCSYFLMPLKKEEIIKLNICMATFFLTREAAFIQALPLKDFVYNKKLLISSHVYISDFFIT
jgi:hypothetical protein